MADAARHRGVQLHLGRVDSWRRYEYARALGCDSGDGALLRFDVAEWVRRSAVEPHLEGDR